MSAGVKRIIVNTSAAPAAIGPYNQVRIKFFFQKNVFFFILQKEEVGNQSIFFQCKGRQKLVYQDFFC